MKAPLDCPTHDQWREFAGAALAREAHEAMDNHLEACAACQETLAALDGTVGLLSPVLARLGQETGQASLDGDPSYRQAVERVKAIRRTDVENSAASSQPTGA